MKFRTLPAKGTRDILPDDMNLRNFVMDIIKDTYKKKGFMHIQTPSIEDIDLLTGSEGGENLSMLFKILKRGEKLDKSNFESLSDLGLRYDLTLPLSRYYANNRNELNSPFKALQMGNVWRAERPQKGRYREFFQCDVDIIGESAIVSEIEVLLTVASTLKKLDLGDFTIVINDRRLLKEVVTSAGVREDDFISVCITLDKLDKIGKDGVKEELSKKNISEEIIEKLFSSINKDLSEFNNEISLGLINIIDIIKEYHNIKFDLTLVRGMGYYTGTIFEFVSNEFKGSIAGGGRYDNLLNKYQNDKIPAVGCSIGFERIVDLLKQRNKKIEDIKKIAIVYMEDILLKEAIKISKEDKYNDDIISVFKINKNKLGKKLNRLEAEGYEEIIVVDRLHKND